MTAKTEAPIRKARQNLESQLVEHGGFLQRSVTITHTKDWWSFAQEAFLIGGSLAALFYMFNNVMKLNDPTGSGQKKEVAESIKTQIIARIHRATGRRIRRFTTTTYEDALLTMIVLPGDLTICFRDIGGLDDIKRDLMETVLIPLMNPSLIAQSRLCVPPLGVLFYGAPGTGKSMMAKAICRETQATFFNVDMSKLMSKWYGDSQKYISALFSLARKMAPSIIWIDEIDALFSMRGGGSGGSEHQADVYNKALFLSLWDGLATAMESGDSSVAQVIIVGATNRPQSVDEAFLRRMPRQYEFPMPDAKTRQLILSIFMQYERVEATVDLEYVAEHSAYYSGSDLKELCKYAATMPLREHVRDSAQKRMAQMEGGMSGFLASDCDDDCGEDLEEAVSGRQKECSKSRFWKSLYTLTPGFWATAEGSTVSGEANSQPAIERYNKTLREGRVRLRPICMEDFECALAHIKSTLSAHFDYESRFARRGAGGSFMQSATPSKGGSMWNPPPSAAARAAAYVKKKRTAAGTPHSTSSRRGSKPKSEPKHDDLLSSLGLD